MKDHFKEFFNDYKLKYIVGITCMLILSFTELIPAYILGKFIDLLKNNELTFSKAAELISIFSFIIIFDYFTVYLGEFIHFKAGDKVCYFSRRKVIKKILNSSSNFFERFSTAKILTICTDDVGALNEYYNFAPLYFVDTIFKPIVITTMLIKLVGLKLTFAMIVFYIIPIVTLPKLNKVIQKSWTNAQKAYDKVNSNVLEDIENIRIIRGFNSQKNRKELFENNSRNIVKEDVSLKKKSELTNLIPSICLIFPYTICFLYGSLLLKENLITVGALTTTFDYLSRLLNYVSDLGYTITVISSGKAAKKRQNELFNYRDDISNGKILLNKIEKIEFRNFSFKYKDKKIINNISTIINAGEKVAVVGKTASGKTTLLKQVLKFYPIIDNTLFLNEKDINSYDIESVRSNFSFVSQDYMIFNESIKENLLRVNPQASTEMLDEALKFAALYDDVMTFSDKIDTKVGETGVSLSGGQKQRLQIARAYLSNRDTMLLDDCLSAIDRKTEQIILKNLYSLENKTIILITHRLNQVKHFDKILVLENGRVTQEGDHNSLLNKESFYKTEYKRQRLEQ